MASSASSAYSMRLFVPRRDECECRGLKPVPVLVQTRNWYERSSGFFATYRVAWSCFGSSSLVMLIIFVVIHNHEFQATKHIILAGGIWSSSSVSHQRSTGSEGKLATMLFMTSIVHHASCCCSAVSYLSSDGAAGGDDEALLMADDDGDDPSDDEGGGTGCHTSTCCCDSLLLYSHHQASSAEAPDNMKRISRVHRDIIIVTWLL